MKLQILIPQYREDESVILPLLKSIELQQSVDLQNDVGVIIANDGSDVLLSDEFLSQFPFQIQYLKCPHQGVSAARNACLDAATADYVMFCDADDLFFNLCAFYILFREMDNGGFDSLFSVFVEESRDPVSCAPVFINHEMDSTFVHGKVHRRQYLLDHHIRWNPALTVHEDSYFNTLCQKIADPSRVKYCPTPFYLWKWRDASVCRHDPKYILKTYPSMLESSAALVREFLSRGRAKDAQMIAVEMIFDSYFTMNKKDWIDQENLSYRLSTEERFAKYYLEFRRLFDTAPEAEKLQIVSCIRQRMYMEGLLMESITFDQWIERVLAQYNEL